MASLTDLPIELLLDIVQYLRPQNKHEPITGLNATWKRIEKYQESLVSEDSWSDSTPSAPLSTYSTLRALHSTCSLLRKICSPLLYEKLNIWSTIDSFEEYYSCFILPNAPSFRHIRLILSTITEDEAARILRTCKRATSVALYADRFQKTDEDESSDLTSTGKAILGLFEEGALNTLGLYSPSILELGLDEDLFITEPLPIIHHLSRSPKSKLTLQRLDLALYEMTEEVYDFICSGFPSLEALTFYYVVDYPLKGVWDYNEEVKWGQYSNLTTLQFIECGRAYSNQISHLVRHFPSLLHLLFSTSDNGTGGSNLKPNDWHSRDDAMWRVRNPLETVHLEHMYGWEINAMGDIPTRTLIVTNLRADFLIGSMRNDMKIFPGLQTIRIQPAVIPEYHDGGHPFIDDTLSVLEDICKARGVTITRDAEAVMMFPRHGY